jgi:hypothetical protein
MVGGFLTAAIGIVATGYPSFEEQVISFMAFGLSMMVAGLFSQRR